MTPSESREYVNKRFKELEDIDPMVKVNRIIGELRKYHRFVTVIHPHLPVPIMQVWLDDDGILRFVRG